MWRKSSSSGSVKPEALDKESSKVVVYVRKDFTEVPSHDMDGTQTGTRWEYMENAVPKEDWGVYEQIVENMNGIADLEDALCELSTQEV